MASGAARVMRGSFVGTGAALTVRTVGFRPRSVKLFNQTGLATAQWVVGMTDLAGLKQVTDGTISLMTAGVTPLSNGFGLGADSDLNASAEVVYYEATD